MPFTQPITNLLEQLRMVIYGLTNAQFTQPVTVLSGSTIGQHTRHIVEFYLELNKGYTNGTVDYDQRERNHYIQTDRDTAMAHLHRISEALEKPDRKLFLTVNHGDNQSIATNYHRELIYNLEHTVHHMALIRIGVAAVSAIEIPDGFGIAASTLKYRQLCAQ